MTILPSTRKVTQTASGISPTNDRIAHVQAALGAINGQMILARVCRPAFSNKRGNHMH